MGETCPLCGGKLTKASQRLSWQMVHVPVRDWLSWNEILRVGLPVFLLVVGIIFGSEGLLRGASGIRRLMDEGALGLLAGLVACMAALTLALLLAQGQEEIIYIIDSKGVHVQTYLYAPTRFKLWCRLRSAAVLKQHAELPAGEALLIGERHLEWKLLRRVQLWPGKPIILLYSPKWWLHTGLMCPPGIYEDALDFIVEKTRRMKQVQLRLALPARAAQNGAGEEESAADGETETLAAARQLTHRATEQLHMPLPTQKAENVDFVSEQEKEDVTQM